MPTKLQTLESPNGIGTVYKDNRTIATVYYSLQVEQEIIVSKSFTHTEEIPGQKRITGQITVDEGERDLMDGSVLVLQLADGRRWHFVTISGNPISGKYRANTASGGGLADS